MRVTEACGSITRISASIDLIGHRETLVYDYNDKLVATTNRNARVIRYQQDAPDNALTFTNDLLGAVSKSWTRSIERLAD